MAESGVGREKVWFVGVLQVIFVHVQVVRVIWLLSTYSFVCLNFYFVRIAVAFIPTLGS